MKVEVNFSKKKTLSFLAVLILLSGVVAVIALTPAPNPGHPADQIGPGTFHGDTSDSWNFPGSVSANDLTVNNLIGGDQVAANRIQSNGQFCLGPGNGNCISSWPTGGGGADPLTESGMIVAGSIAVSSTNPNAPEEFIINNHAGTPTQVDYVLLQPRGNNSVSAHLTSGDASNPWVVISNFGGAGTINLNARFKPGSPVDRSTIQFYRNVGAPVVTVDFVAMKNRA